MWAQYKSDGNPTNLILHYLPLVSLVARSKFPTYFKRNHDDFISAGMMGINNAIESWESTEGNGNFRAYVSACIYRAFTSGPVQKYSTQKRDADTVNIYEGDSYSHDEQLKQIDDRDQIAKLFDGHEDMYRIMSSKFIHCESWEALAKQHKTSARTLKRNVDTFILQLQESAC